MSLYRITYDKAISEPSDAWDLRDALLLALNTSEAQESIGIVYDHNGSLVAEVKAANYRYTTPEIYNRNVDYLRSAIKQATELDKKTITISVSVARQASNNIEDMELKLAEIKRRLQQMRERHTPGLFTAEMERLIEIADTSKLEGKG